jgi:TatD DNase family protein
MAYCDSHCHLDRYEPALLTEILEQARLKDVGIIVGMGMTLESSTETIRIAQSYDGVLAAVGIHPWNAVPPTAEVYGCLAELAEQEHVVAFGEIGLDYARTPQTREIQRDLLIHELFLAAERGLPVSIHCREAHEDMLQVLRQETGSDLRGVIHGFSGDLATLNDWLDLGFYVSVGVRGFVTNETPSLMEAIAKIPLDRLLTESDSATVDQLVGPAAVPLVVKKLASVLGATAEEIANAATANLKRLLNLSSPDHYE